MLHRLQLILIAAFAAISTAGAQSLWRAGDATGVKKNPSFLFLASSATYQVDAKLQKVLQTIPREQRLGDFTGAQFIDLPTPDRTIARFRIINSPVMSPALEKKIPVQTFRVVGVDDPYAHGRLDIGPNGFHGYVMSPEGDFVIEPLTRGNMSWVISYYRRDNLEPNSFVCHTVAPPSPIGGSGHTTLVVQTLKTYRLAMNATGEYSAVFGGTTPAANAAVVTSVNRVDAVYENDLGIHLNLVYTNCYLNGATDPFTNSDGATMLTQNQTNLDSALLGNANYDVGHVFSTGGGGIAGLAVVGRTGQKAKGVTGSPSPFGDGYDIDYVAHEMGHQFGGNHTFNGTTGSCGGGNRAASAAYEPGSGSTIMAYAGICGAEDLQPHSDAYFHTKSWDEIMAWRNNASSGGTSANTSNNIPTVNAGANFTIPINTPFKLTASGSDLDSNPLTYCWEEFDLGTAGPTVDPASSPRFRSANPLSSPTRFFPKLSTVLANTSDAWEVMPSVARTMNFRCTVRDNQTGGGGSVYGGMTITVNSGPAFVVTSPNTAVTWAGGSTQTITWTVGGGSVSPNVNILLSTDGGTSYGTGTATVLLANTPNDGSETITIPNIGTTTARIIVEASSSVFYDVSNTNFTITQTATGTGNVSLGDWVPGPSGVPATIEIKNGSGTVVQTANVTLDASGNFNFPVTVGAGTYTVTAKASHWLRRAVAGVNITAAGFSGVNFSLINGDVNGDNVISLSDFTVLRNAFNSGPSDPNWNANADLNGNGTVSLSDFSILRNNFNLNGD